MYSNNFRVMETAYGQCIKHVDENGLKCRAACKFRDYSAEI